MSIEILDISGDIGLRVSADSLEDAFIAAGMGLYGLISDTAGVRDQVSVCVKVSGESEEELLVRFLNELIFQFDANGFIGCRIELRSFVSGAEFGIAAVVHGEPFDPSRHEQRMLVKAATYHKLSIQETEKRFSIEVVFDI